MALEIALTIIEQVVKIFELKEGHQEKFFKNHIEPIYAELQDVHRDYKMILYEVIHSLEDVNTDTEQLADSVKKAKIHLEASRESLKALANALAMGKHEKIALRKKNPDQLTVKELTYQFASAILNYFQPIIIGHPYLASVSGQTFSAITSLIIILNDFSKSKTPNWKPNHRDEHYLLTKSGAKELAYWIDVNFKEISAYYALLKVACL